MNFTIYKNSRIYRQAVVEATLDVRAFALEGCQKEVAEKRRQWCSLGAVVLSEPSAYCYDMLENYDTSGISVRQHLLIGFFDLLHAVRLGKVKISERKYDEHEDEWYRTFSLVSRGNDD